MENPVNTIDKFHPEIKVVADQLFLTHRDVSEGHMFGYPGYYVKRKLIACHYGNGLALKLPEKTVDKILSSNEIFAEPFCPMGRKMGKHWIIIFKQGDRLFQLPRYIVEEAVEFSCK